MVDVDVDFDGDGDVNLAGPALTPRLVNGVVPVQVAVAVNVHVYDHDQVYADVASSKRRTSAVAGSRPRAGRAPSRATPTLTRTGAFPSMANDARSANE